MWRGLPTPNPLLTKYLHPPPVHGFLATPHWCKYSQYASGLLLADFPFHRRRTYRFEEMSLEGSAAVFYFETIYVELKCIVCVLQALALSFRILIFNFKDNISRKSDTYVDFFSGVCKRKCSSSNGLTAGPPGQF